MQYYNGLFDHEYSVLIYVQQSVISCGTSFSFLADRESISLLSSSEVFLCVLYNSSERLNSGPCSDSSKAICDPSKRCSASKNYYSVLTK